MRHGRGRARPSSPIEDLRIDFEDGYGVRRGDDVEDALAAAAAGAAPVALASAPPFSRPADQVSLEPATVPPRRPHLDLFLGGRATRRRPGFLVTLPKVDVAPAQVERDGAAVPRSCEHVATAWRRERLRLRAAGRDAAGGPRRRRARRRRGCGWSSPARPAGAGCTTAPTTTAPPSASRPREQTLDHPVADHAKAVMQVAVAGDRRARQPTAPRTSCRSATRHRAPPGSCTPARRAGRSDAASTRAGTCTPAQLPTRYAATYAFYRAALRGRSTGSRPTSTPPVTSGILDVARDRPGAGRLPAAAAWTVAPWTRHVGPFDRRGRSEASGWHLRDPFIAAVAAACHRPVGPARRWSPCAPGGSPSVDCRGSPADRATSATSCCCPGWSTPTCTSTSPAAPSGRASPPPPGRRPRAGSPPSSTCRSTRCRRPSTAAALAQAQAAATGQVLRRRRLLGRRDPRQRRRAAPAARRRRLRFQELPGRLRRPRVPRWSRRGLAAALAAVDALFIVHAEDPGPAASRLSSLREESSSPRAAPSSFCNPSRSLFEGVDASYGLFHLGGEGFEFSGFHGCGVTPLPVF